MRETKEHTQETACMVDGRKWNGIVKLNTVKDKETKGVVPGKLAVSICIRSMSVTAVIDAPEWIEIAYE